MLSPSLTLVVVRKTVTDTSFDTNPAQPTETTSNTGIEHSAYLCQFCNYEQRPETPRLRLRIRRSQVRVLPSVNKDLLGTRKSLHILKDIAHSYPLEAHLCCSVVKLGMERKLGKVCNFGTARWRRRGGSCGISRRARRRGRSRSRCWRAVRRRARPLGSTRRVTTPQVPAPTRSRSLWWGRARAPRFPGKPPPNRDSSTAPAAPPASPQQKRPLGLNAPPSSGSPPSPASRTSGSPLPLSCARPPLLHPSRRSPAA